MPDKVHLFCIEYLREGITLYEKYLNVISEKADIFCHVSDFLWDNPELGFQEYKASKLICDIMEENGFTVVRGIAGMSQEACVIEKKSIPGLDAGHGCGHNLFAGGSVAAAFAVKSYIEATGKGSVTLFGCPAEEGGHPRKPCEKRPLMHQ